MKLRAHHIAFTVGNIELIENFYEYFGFSIWKKYEDDSYKISHLRNEYNFIIELFESKRSRENSYKLISKHNLNTTGIKHFAFEVNDIDTAYKEFKSKGVIAKDSLITVGRMKIKYFFVVDPEGNMIEIVEDSRE
jgi:glyoxylase I family protein